MTRKWALSEVCYFSKENEQARIPETLALGGWAKALRRFLFLSRPLGAVPVFNW